MLPPKLWGVGLPRTGTTSLWKAFIELGYDNAAHNPFFEQLRTLDAGTDAGVAVFFKYLYYKFPDSKFILTTREVEAWLPSVKHIIGSHPLTGRPREDDWLQRRTLLWGTPTYDEAKMRETHHRHNNEVREFFKDKPGKLLEMDICAGDGWEKLCAFLEVPVPVTPFPSFNSR